jgi:CDP-diacylglycerol--glycerol-3-phosphate 3-phosphatidyltransferase
MSKALNVPNQITIARFVLAVVFCVLLAQYSQRDPKPWMLDLAAGLFIVAAATDFLDGYLARKWQLVTPLGRILDPLVDKLLVCGAFILFVGPEFVDSDGNNVTEMKTWMVVFIVGREMLVTSLRGFNESMGKAFGASIHGKLKMWMQSIAAPAILLVVAHEGTSIPLETARAIKLVLVWATVIVTALSMFQYLIRSRYILEESASA